ncbi:MAG: glutamine--fructose-6-phosphate transaminase (isomerizing) [archaeon]
MCGIVAYLGNKEAYPILIKGLERLEYRGYDSAGVATLQNNQITINKQVGKVANLKSQVLTGNIGIAHTRWATHGSPTQENAHPHQNDEKSLVLVHNGIIENYAKLKKDLIAKGYSFYSETDTEVLTKLIDYHNKIKNEELGLGNHMAEALKCALHDVVGAYGIVILNKDEDKLYAARKGSPLVLGIGKDDNGNNEYFVASDPAAFLEYTRRVLYLEDEDILVIDRNNYQLNSLHEHCDHPNRKIKQIDWNLSQIEKNGYEHFMLKEIHEQPETLHNCLAGRIDLNNLTTKFSSQLSDQFIKKIDRIIFAACGTSWHAAMVAKYLIEKYARIKVDVEYASEFRYKNPILSEKDLVIVISQSGETADTLAALKTGRERGAKTFGIVNVVGSSIAREVESGIYIHAGPEIGVASTKAFTGQVLSILFLMVHLGKIRSTITDIKAQEILNQLQNVPQYVKETFSEEQKIKAIAKEIAKKNNCFFLGRGVNIATAMEGALKMKEISYIYSEAFPAGEMKHGPIALLEPNFPVITIATKDDQTIYDKILSNIEEVKAREAKVIAIANEGDNEIVNVADHVIWVPAVPDYLQAIVNVIPLQLLAYYTANERGCEIDQPRNLAKSVTVE